MQYARREASGSVTTETIDALAIAPEGSLVSTGPQANDTSPLALNTMGTPHAAYLTATGLRHAVRQPNGTWLSEPIPIPGAVGSTSFVIDKENTPHVVTIAGSNLHYARCPQGGVWTETTIGPAVSLGGGRSLAVDSTGLVHVVYLKTATERAYASACP